MPDTFDRLGGARSTLGVKTPCLAATTAAITLSGLQTVDGVALAEGNRVLVKDQADTTTNGVYVASASAWSRAKDFDGTTDWVKGTLVPVSGGTVSGGKLFRVTSNDPTDVGAETVSFGDISYDPTNSNGLISGRNLLHNPHGFVFQRGSPLTVADDAYGHDRWYALTQTSSITIETRDEEEPTTPRLMRLTQAQAVAQRMGYAQIQERLACAWLRGRSVTLSGRIRCSAATNIRYAILEWTGTSDSVTSDVVNDWTSSSYTAGNFFIAANLTVRAVGVMAVTANTFTDLSALTATLGTTFNDLIVFVWTESAQAQNVTLDMSMQLEEGTVATAREFKDQGAEFQICQRYFYSSYNHGTTPGSTGEALYCGYVVTTATTSSIGVQITAQFPVSMRQVPSVVTLYSRQGASGRISINTPGSNSSSVAASVPAADTLRRGIAFLNNISTANWPAGSEYEFNLTADAEL